MTTKPSVVCWDSCVIIDFLKQTEGRYQNIAPMIQEAEAGKLLIVVSEISVAEVYKLARPTAENVNPQSILDWFEHDYVESRVVDRGISTLAGQLRRSHGTTTCDSIILATAATFDIPTIYTTDGLKDDGQINPRKLLALDNLIPIKGGDAMLRVVPPSGRADGQISIDDIADEADE